MKYQGDELLAKLTIYGFERQCELSKKNIIAWLRREADFLENKDNEINKTYTSRFMLNDRSNKK